MCSLPRISQATLRQPEEGAPVVPWADWYAEKWHTWRQGQHQLFVGPTQSGKTTLARQLARLRNYVVVFGTKAYDESLDAFLDEGYRRITQWPPRKKDLEPDEAGDVRLILWPKIKSIPDLWEYKPVYSKCLNSIFIEGRWTLVLDEGIWLADKGGLDLGKEISAIAYGSASNKVSMCLLTQRPSGLPRISWSSVTDAHIFHTGVTTDVRELASLGTYDPADVKRVVQRLEGRQFLDLPVRGGKEWAISEVQL